VSDISISTLAREKAELVAETAQEALGALAQKVQPTPTKKRRRRMWPIALLVLVVAGGIAVWWTTRRSEPFDADYDAAPDAFGEAVMEERAAADTNRSKVATPGA
jgi:hypothetical protein